MCSECVQSVFRVCLECAQGAFRVCSECVQSAFSVCSECVQSVFNIDVISSPSASSVSIFGIFTFTTFKRLCMVGHHLILRDNSVKLGNVKQETYQSWPSRAKQNPSA